MSSWCLGPPPAQAYASYGILPHFPEASAQSVPSVEESDLVQEPDTSPLRLSSVACTQNSHSHGVQGSALCTPNLPCSQHELPAVPQFRTDMAAALPQQVETGALLGEGREAGWSPFPEESSCLAPPVP